MMRLGSASAASRLVVPSWMAAPSVKRINSKRRCVQLVSKWPSRWIESRPCVGEAELVCVGEAELVPAGGRHARCRGPCVGGRVSGAVQGPCRGGVGGG